MCELIIKWQEQYRNVYAYSITLLFSSLNLGGPFIVGHLPEQFNYNYVKITYSSLAFCVRELIVNGQLQDFSSPLEAVGLSPSCDSQCTSGLCKNGGSCIASQSSFTCICPAEYAGTTCNESKSLHVEA